MQNRGIILFFADRPSTGKIAAFPGLLSRLPPGTVQRSAGTLAGIIRAYVYEGDRERARVHRRDRAKGRTDRRARHRQRLQRSGPGPGEKSPGGEGPRAGLTKGRGQGPKRAILIVNYLP